MDSVTSVKYHAVVQWLAHAVFHTSSYRTVRRKDAKQGKELT